MTNEQSHQIVLKDQQGNYYLLSPQMLDQARVPANQVADIDARLTNDTTGFYTDAAGGFRGAFTGAPLLVLGQLAPRHKQFDGVKGA